MKEIAFDIETTIFPECDVYHKDRRVVCWSAANDTVNEVHYFHKTSPQAILDEYSLLIGFNFKFDHRWMTRIGFDLSKHQVWDCQLAEFVLSGQTTKTPSLDQLLAKYGIPLKYDIVKNEYWNKGIDTFDIPWLTLREYSLGDSVKTFQLKQKQWEKATSAQKTLILLMGQDQKILAQMEENGLPFNRELCEIRSKEIDAQIENLTKDLASLYPAIPINFNSGDHLSAFLYGGTITEVKKVLSGFYKTGPNAGQPKYSNQEVIHQLPRRFSPLKKSELKKEGYFATDEATLKKLKGKDKWIIDALLKLAKLEKLNGTYYKGLPKLADTKQWEDGKLHGVFNQCIAGTGRLSSSSPNVQNFADELQDILESEFNE